MKMIVYADGACKGNPGPMGIGASIQDEHGKELGMVSQLIGHGTNNVAEYQAAIAGLRQARTLGVTNIELRMDSELVIRQVQGAYKVRKETLKPLHPGDHGYLRASVPKSEPRMG